MSIKQIKEKQGTSDFCSLLNRNSITSTAITVGRPEEEVIDFAETINEQ